MEKECFVLVNIHTYSVNYSPILEAGYLMIKYEEWTANNMEIIFPGLHKTNSVSSHEPLFRQTEVYNKWEVSLVSEKSPHQNRFTDLELDDSLDSSDQSAFDSAVDDIAEWGYEWENVNKITNLSNTYPCSLRPSTRLSIEDMDLRLGGVSIVKA